MKSENQLKKIWKCNEKSRTLKTFFTEDLHKALKIFCKILWFEILHIFITLHITKSFIKIQFHCIQQKSMEVTEE